ncbi:MAG: hypothetical protein Q9159_004036 [Coniocarpon cinnabarinum]
MPAFSPLLAAGLTALSVLSPTTILNGQTPTPSTTARLDYAGPIGEPYSATYSTSTSTSNNTLVHLRQPTLPITSAGALFSRRAEAAAPVASSFDATTTANAPWNVVFTDVAEASAALARLNWEVAPPLSSVVEDVVSSVVSSSVSVGSGESSAAPTEASSSVLELSSSTAMALPFPAVSSSLSPVVSSPVAPTEAPSPVLGQSLSAATEPTPSPSSSVPPPASPSFWPDASPTPPTRAQLELAWKNMQRVWLHPGPTPLKPLTEQDLMQPRPVAPALRSNISRAIEDYFDTVRAGFRQYVAENPPTLEELADMLVAEPGLVPVHELNVSEEEAEALMQEAKANETEWEEIMQSLEGDWNQSAAVQTYYQQQMIDEYNSLANCTPVDDQNNGETALQRRSDPQMETHCTPEIDRRKLHIIEALLGGVAGSSFAAFGAKEFVNDIWNMYRPGQTSHVGNILARFSAQKFRFYTKFADPEWAKGYVLDELAAGRIPMVRAQEAIDLKLQFLEDMKLVLEHIYEDDPSKLMQVADQSVEEIMSNPELYDFWKIVENNLPFQDAIEDFGKLGDNYVGMGDLMDDMKKASDVAKGVVKNPDVPDFVDQLGDALPLLVEPGYKVATKVPKFTKQFTSKAGHGFKFGFRSLTSAFHKLSGSILRTSQSSANRVLKLERDFAHDLSDALEPVRPLTSALKPSELDVLRSKLPTPDLPKDITDLAEVQRWLDAVPESAPKIAPEPAEPKPPSSPDYGPKDITDPVEVQRWLDEVPSRIPPKSPLRPPPIPPKSPLRAPPIPPKSPLRAAPEYKARTAELQKSLDQAKQQRKAELESGRFDPPDWLPRDIMDQAAVDRWLKMDVGEGARSSPLDQRIKKVRFQLGDEIKNAGSDDSTDSDYHKKFRGTASAAPANEQSAAPSHAQKPDSATMRATAEPSMATESAKSRSDTLASSVAASIDTTSSVPPTLVTSTRRRSTVTKTMTMPESTSTMFLTVSSELPTSWRYPPATLTSTLVYTTNTVVEQFEQLTTVT